MALAPGKFAMTELPVGVPKPEAIGHVGEPLIVPVMTFVFLLIDHVTPPPSPSVMPRVFRRKFEVSETLKVRTRLRASTLYLPPSPP